MSSAPPLPIKSGDQLRDDAERLLASKFGPIRKEVRADGKKVDLFFAQRHFGKLTRIYVEAKDYARPLQRQHVVQIWADYMGLVEKAQPASLLLVTRHGLTTDADAYVQSELHDCRHQTLLELENEVFGMTEYIESLTGLFDEDGLSRYYVNGRARLATYTGDHERKLSSGIVDLRTTIEGWIEGADPTPRAVLGGYGAGKTSFAKRLISEQAKRALVNPAARRPVLIRLGAFVHYSSLQGLLGGMFTHDFPIENFNAHRFLDLNRRGRLLIVLDGFDEMKHAMTWPDFRAQAQELNRLIEGDARVLLLGRPNAFTTADEHVHVLRGVRRYDGGWLRLAGWPEFEEFDLESFTPAERIAFVSGYLNRDGRREPSWVVQRANQVNALADQQPDVFAKPVHAKILTDLADSDVDLSRLSPASPRWGLYAIFFESLASREMDKAARRPVAEEDRLNFLRELAFWLWTAKGGSISFSAAELPDSLLAEFPDGDAPDPEAKKREYLTGAFLEKKAGDTFYFGHRSFAEFLVAQRMVLRPPHEADHGVYGALAVDGVDAFLREAPDRRAIQSWVDTLSHVRGPVRLEYFAFLADIHGGLKPLLDAMPSSSIWRRVFEVFDDDLMFEGGTADRIISAMHAPENVLFAYLYQLLRIQLAYERTGAVTRPRALAVRLAAVLLDRVFETAELKPEETVTWAQPSATEARELAVAVLPELQSRYGGRDLEFRGTRLAQKLAEVLKLSGSDLTSSLPPATQGLEYDDVLPWSDVLQAMSTTTRGKAEAYFRRTSDLRNLKIRGQTRRR